MNIARDQLVAVVQRNCHIADARYARGMGLCSYLLEMREYYRWEAGLPLSSPPPRAEVSRWIAARENYWNELEDCDFSPLPLGELRVDPFAVDAVNRELLSRGLVYGAGIGRFHQPHFFLAELERRELRDGVVVLVSGREVARDLSAAPAATRGGIVYLRREALTRWLWGKAEAWDGQQRDGALKRALGHYGYDSDRQGAIERMSEAECETLILHELGEHAVGRRFGPDWEEMLAGFSGKRAEILARAVRDNLADCLTTLPTLLERETLASLHFWFANFDGMRRALFPRLALAYRDWGERGERAALTAAIAAGAQHWRDVGQRLLALQCREEAEAQIEALAEGDELTL